MDELDMAITLDGSVYWRGISRARDVGPGIGFFRSLLYLSFFFLCVFPLVWILLFCGDVFRWPVEGVTLGSLERRMVSALALAWIFAILLYLEINGLARYVSEVDQQSHQTVCSLSYSGGDGWSGLRPPPPFTSF